MAKNDKQGKNEMLLRLKSQIIYGPVISRRLGRSLGLNILPSGHKCCPFDCLYCQYGFTQSNKKRPCLEQALPTPIQVLSALEEALKRWGGEISHITFSGNGEPTLHPQFPDISRAVIQMRDTLARGVKTAILSNSATVIDIPTRDAVMNLDKKIMKLDAGNQQMFAHYNRPQASIKLKNIVEGLSALPGITIQSLFSKGPDGNYTNEHINNWIEQICRVSPNLVQVYTLDRVSPTRTLIKLSKEELITIQDRLADKKIRCQIFP
jgi:wyosine [tRNA(Phe)-imidazoG37] synthetase (radical SAM superfamily)